MWHFWCSSFAVSRHSFGQDDHSPAARCAAAPQSDNRAVPPLTFAPLLHLLGFLTGAALYALLLALVSRKQATFDYLPLLTAMLGLLWNMIGLAAYGIRDFAGREPSPWLMATAYSALGFLPAVVVHSVLRGPEGVSRKRATGTVIATAYFVSTAAETLMYWSARSGVAPSVPALRLLTWSYAALTIPVLFLTRRRGDSARGWSIVALAVFAISALHLSHHQGHESLLVELVGHHASILLIFAILYQDFRFALADQFLKRALALFGVITIAAALYFGIAVPVFHRHEFDTDAVGVGVVLILWVGTATLYPLMTRAAGWFVDRVVLRRANYDDLLDRVARAVSSAASPQEVLDAVCANLEAALSAEYVRCIEDTRTISGAPRVTIDTAEPARYALVVGPLLSGRSLLSDDDQLLRAVAAAAARRIDSLRLARERYEQSMREQEMSKLATEAELRALRAQINPHFLFNALNTIGFLVQTSPERARSTLLKLTAMLRGVLRSGGSTSTVGEEIDLVSAYLEIEQARFEERLRVTIDVPDDVRALRMPPLIVQPLVENAVKHGIARSRGGGELRVVVRREPSALHLTVFNTGAPATEFDIAHGRRRGFGLANIEQRLAHLFGGEARLTLSADASGTAAEVVMPVSGEPFRSVERSA